MGWLVRNDGVTKSLLVLALSVAVLLTARPASAVEITIHSEPGEIILGEQETLQLLIEATGEGAAEIRGIAIHTSVGHVGSPRLVGPGRWTATYWPPVERFPQIAMLIVRTLGPAPAAFGATTIPMHGRRTIAIRTDRDATASISVGGRTFGPERPNREGIAHIEVTVPPGFSIARARTEDALGNSNDRDVDLELPLFPRFLVSTTSRIVAGAEARVAVMALDDAGRPQPWTELHASRGEVSFSQSSPLLSLFEFRAPDRVADGTIQLSLSQSDDMGNVPQPVTVDLLAGPPNRLVLTADRETVIPGTDQNVMLHATVVDRHGNLRESDRPHLWVAGQRLASNDSLTGGSEAVLTAPPAEVGLGTMLIEARAGEFYALSRIRLVGGPASLARLVAPEQAVADGRTAAPLRVLLTGETGLPASEVPAVRVSSGDLRDMRREVDGWWHVTWIPGRSSLLGPDEATIEVARGPASARARVRLSPPIPWLTMDLLAGLRTNAGALTGPEGRIELAGRVPLRRGWLEIAVQSGLTYSRIDEATARGQVILHLYQVPFSAGIGYGLRLRGPVGMIFSTRGGAVLLTTVESTTFQPEARRVFVVPLVEGAIEITIGLGRGEIFARSGFGYAAAPQGSGLTGNLMGLMLLGGYRLFLF